MLTALFLNESKSIKSLSELTIMIPSMRTYVFSYNHICTVSFCIHKGKMWRSKQNRWKDSFNLTFFRNSKIRLIACVITCLNIHKREKWDTKNTKRKRLYLSFGPPRLAMLVRVSFSSQFGGHGTRDKYKHKKSSL